MGFRSLTSMYKFAKSRFVTHKPFVLMHYLTFRCNLRCEMCEFWKVKYKELELGQTLRMIDSAKEAGFFVYQAMGGEPLLVKNLPEIFAYAKERGFLTYLNTNGILLKKRAKEIAPFLDALATSIDGSEITHDKIRGHKGAYKKTIEGIKEAKKMGLNLRIISTIGRDNINEMEQVARLAEKLEVPLIFSLRYNKGKVGLNQEELRKFIEKLISLKNRNSMINNSTEGIKYLEIYNKTCNYFRVFLWVFPSGEVISCMRGILGNIKSMSFEEILNSERYKKFASKVKNCKRNCKIACVIETNSLYNLNPSKIFDFLRRGFL